MWSAFSKVVAIAQSNSDSITNLKSHRQRPVDQISFRMRDKQDILNSLKVSFGMSVICLSLTRKNAKYHIKDKSTKL